MLPASEAAQAKEYFDRAAELVEVGKIEGAQAECEEAIELQPDYADAHALLGLIYADQGLLMPSITSFSEAIKLAIASEDLATV